MSPRSRISAAARFGFVSRCSLRVTALPCAGSRLQALLLPRRKRLGSGRADAWRPGASWLRVARESPASTSGRRSRSQLLRHAGDHRERPAPGMSGTRRTPPQTMRSPAMRQWKAAAGRRATMTPRSPGARAIEDVFGGAAEGPGGGDSPRTGSARDSHEQTRTSQTLRCGIRDLGRHRRDDDSPGRQPRHARCRRFPPFLADIEKSGAANLPLRARGPAAIARQVGGAFAALTATARKP